MFKNVVGKVCGICTAKFFLRPPNNVPWQFSKSEDRAQSPIFNWGYPLQATNKKLVINEIVEGGGGGDLYQIKFKFLIF